MPQPKVYRNRVASAPPVEVEPEVVEPEVVEPEVVEPAPKKKRRLKKDA